MKYATSLSLKTLAGVAALCLATQAHATTISIGLQQAGTNGGAVSTVATDNAVAGSAVFAGSYGSFTFNTVTAQGAPLLTQGSLSTTSIQTSASSAGTITIYITEQGLTSPTGLTSFLSSFTSNTFAGTATSVVESTFVSSTNALYDGTQMATSTFTNIGTNVVTNSTSLGPLYSETVKFVVTVGAGFSNVNDTINISAAATPEPSSLIMLGTGLMSAAGMMVRRRKIS